MKKFMIPIAFLLIPFLLFSKRIAPRELESIYIDDLEFRVEHFSTDSNNRPINGGVIEVWNTKTKSKDRIIVIYKTRYNSLLERDFQGVFITDIQLNEEKRIIEIINEKNEKYELNFQTFKVRKR